jgi:hypothetical protein
MSGNNIRGHGFGTSPVFLAAISTILGAILFLRFGYAVAHAGLTGTLLIILIGHAITIPTAMAIAEIATNLKVEGGGEYFIISRSFGSMVVSTLGISLLMFFLGKTSPGPNAPDIFTTVKDPHDFFIVFAIIFPLKSLNKLLQAGKGKTNEPINAMLKGVLLQLTRRLQVLIQKKQPRVGSTNWRPSFIAISSSSLSRLAPFDLLRWIAHYYGFGTFIHFIKGPLNDTTQADSRKRLEQLIDLVTKSEAGIYVDTIISPSFKTAVAQIVQIPGIAGMENNSILFEFDEDHPEAVTDIIDGCEFASIVDYNICVLRSSERHFGYKKRIDIWLTPGDYRNANMMILLAYILMGHPEWKGCKVTLFAAFESDEMETNVMRLNRLISQGRIPISQKNVQKIPWDKGKTSYDAMVTEHSEEADLVIMGFSLEKLVKQKGSFFKRFEGINDILFVQAGQRIIITGDS